jgi:hypothetical protein
MVETRSLKIASFLFWVDITIKQTSWVSWVQ